ncbi:MAG: hypothetical protein WAX77_12420 [Methylococcaceae bacterium]
MIVRDYLGDKLKLYYYYRHLISYARRGIFLLINLAQLISGVNRLLPPNYQLHGGEPKAIDIKTIRPLSTLNRSYLQAFL